MKWKLGLYRGSNRCAAYTWALTERHANFVWPCVDVTELYTWSLWAGAYPEGPRTQIIGFLEHKQK